ncbi:MAG: glycosyltransferase [Rhodococcus sp. (in: high G+C Gram-positive bacteria)]|uniref:glycosyltransferase n=1 Tax=Rhodococcus sp. TaxID=1831 RepID=UPI002ADD1635|nr:glycosyltransferase [Rhodococcus sp. (in: high G+C Gram-positive bacteria)]MDZ7930485.1 glycosyltransferase [Rhodococcus sp. (in: high G+C Gram-positive bacteria)]
MTDLRIGIMLYGSRGDIQPGVCLALELQARGARPIVAVPPNLVDFAESVGVLSVMPLGLDTHTAWSSDEANTARSRHPIAKMKFALATVRAGFRAFDDALVQLFLAEDAPMSGVDALVVSPLGQDRAFALSQKLDVPLTVLRYGPMSENGVLGAIPGLTSRWTATWKRRSWRIADRITWWATGWNENAFRRRIGLPRARSPLPCRLSASGVLQIQAFDPVIVPGLAEEWGTHKPVVGFFDLPRRERAGLDETVLTSKPDGHSGSSTDSLGDWMSAGSPPVFFGFGSMPLTDPEQLVETVREAGRLVGIRCLIAIGDRRGPDSADPDVFFVGNVDHAAVLPRCAAVVHHGGAGTTAAAMRAGLPMVICTVTADQPFWGARVTELGVGRAMKLSEISAQKLADALSAALAPHCVATAASLGSSMTAPHKAVADAADLILRTVRDSAVEAIGPTQSGMNKM